MTGGSCVATGNHVALQLRDAEELFMSILEFAQVSCHVCPPAEQVHCNPALQGLFHHRGIEDRVKPTSRVDKQHQLCLLSPRLCQPLTHAGIWPLLLVRDGIEPVSLLQQDIKVCFLQGLNRVLAVWL